MINQPIRVLQTGLPELEGVLSKKSNGAFGSWQQRFFKVRASASMMDDPMSEIAKAQGV